ncbi:hypothetical protein HY990_07025 [Candidatus Micrarchaeota archaeon]|nr:hypothetical protein [Candidatus Micrarchaeota archaeon]
MRFSSFSILPVIFVLLILFGCTIPNFGKPISPDVNISIPPNNYAIGKPSSPSNSCGFPNSDLTYNIPTPKSFDSPLLVIIADRLSTSDPAPSISQTRNWFFGETNSIADYFYNISNTKGRLHEATILKYPLDHDWQYYWDYNDPNDSDGDGIISGEQRFYSEMLKKADPDFDFSRYDTNYDGILTPQELGIFIVLPHNTPGPGGATRPSYGREFGGSVPMHLDGVDLTWLSSSGSGNPLNVGTPSHELLHLYLGTQDLYFTYFFPYAAGAYSIMDQPWSAPHLDPYQKMRAGWLDLKVIDSSGCYQISRVDYSHTVAVLKHPIPAGYEFYIIENRQRGAYDASIPDSGLGIWRAIEGPRSYDFVSKPDLVLDSNWATIAKTDWGRLGLWMYRPGYYPFDDSKGLWSNDDLYFLGQPLVLNWSDGSEAFRLTNVSSSGDVMNYTIELPSK